MSKAIAAVNGNTDGITELYRKFRPTLFKEVIGQDEAVKELRSYEKNNTWPHVFLFVGKSGVGKSTLAYIISQKLGCGGKDFYEINAANDRGIDMVRSINDRIGMSAFAGKGKPRVWLLDECFHGDTEIDTPHGKKQISEIEVGDMVYNISGISKVSWKFKNKVPLERVVRVVFSSGCVVFTSSDHLFLTDEGWVPAKQLLGKSVYEEEHGKEDLRRVRHQIRGKQKLRKEILFPKLRWKMEKRPTGIQGKSIYERERGKTVEISEGVLQVRKRRPCSKTILNSHEKEQSMPSTGNRSEDVGHQEKEWDSSCVERETWGKRDTDATTEKTMEGSWRNHQWLDNGMFYSNQGEAEQFDRISECLQNRHRKQGNEIGGGSGRQGASNDKEQVQGFEKRSTVKKVGVVCVEIFESGSNDQSFLGVVTDRDKERGFVEFYDLEIDGHPSYFAAGVAVHNCHRLTPDSMSSLLLLLEHPPANAYFILCTNEPQKLLETLRTRCAVINLKPLSDEDIRRVLESVATKMGNVRVSEELIKRITEASDGSARQALQLLNKVLCLDKEEDRLNAIVKNTSERDSFDLVKMLLWKKSTWQEVAGMLANMKDDPEGIRRLIMKNAGNELIKKGGNAGWANLIIEFFKDPFFDCGETRLRWGCYLTMKNRGNEKGI